MKRYVILVLVLVVVMSGCVEKQIPATTTTVVSTTTIQPKEVIVLTDKSEYVQGEVVDVAVTNYLDESVWYRKWCGMLSFWFLEKDVGGEWEGVQIRGPCLSATSPLFIELESGGSISSSWDMYWYVGGWNYSKPVENLGLAEPGTYRFGFVYHPNCSKVQDYYDCKYPLNPITVYSNEFTVKEGQNITTTSTTTTVITYPRGVEFEALSQSLRCNRARGSSRDVIKTEEELKEMWDSDLGELPKVNFSDEMVLAVFYGSTSGKGIEITEILEMEDKIVVIFDIRYWIDNTRRRSNPCYIVSIGRTDKPIVFVENRKYCTGDGDCVLGPRESASLYFYEWCDQSECINNEGYGEEKTKYANKTDCKVQHAPVSCTCVDSTCTAISEDEISEYLVKKYEPYPWHGMPQVFSDEIVNETLSQNQELVNFIIDRFNTTNDFDIFEKISQFKSITLTKTDFGYNFTFSSGGCVVTTYEGKIRIDAGQIIDEVTSEVDRSIPC